MVYVRTVRLGRKYLRVTFDCPHFNEVTGKCLRDPRFSKYYLKEVYDYCKEPNSCKFATKIKIEQY
jgi:hypothetical protein